MTLSRWDWQSSGKMGRWLRKMPESRPVVMYVYAIFAICITFWNLREGTERCWVGWAIVVIAGQQWIERGLS